MKAIQNFLDFNNANAEIEKLRNKIDDYEQAKHVFIVDEVKKYLIGKIVRKYNGCMYTKITDIVDITPCCNMYAIEVSAERWFYNGDEKSYRDDVNYNIDITIKNNALVPIFYDNGEFVSEDDFNQFMERYNQEI